MFANHPNGRFLAYGIRDIDAHLIGVDQEQASKIIGTLTNLGRDAIEPPLALDHAIVEFRGVSLLLAYIPEQSNNQVA